MAADRTTGLRWPIRIDFTQSPLIVASLNKDNSRIKILETDRVTFFRISVCPEMESNVENVVMETVNNKGLWETEVVKLGVR